MLVGGTGLRPSVWRTLVRRRGELRALSRALLMLPVTGARMRRPAFIEQVLRRELLAADDASSGTAAHAAIAAAASVVAPSEIPRHQRDRLSRLARLVELAARYGVTEGTCLSRSLTLIGLARREGIPARLRIGVRAPGAGFAAHAWVECGSLTLGLDSDRPGRYVPMTSPVASPAPGSSRAVEPAR